MLIKREIELPQSTGGAFAYRAFREGNTIAFEPVVEPGSWERLGFAVMLAVSALPLAAYAFFAVIAAQAGSPFGWPGYAVGLGFGLLFLIIVVRQSVDIMRFRRSVLERDADGMVQLRYHSGLRERLYSLCEPACLLVLLHHGVGGIVGWETFTDTDGKRRRRRYRDMIEVELRLQGTSANPRIPILTRRWIPLVPRFMSLHFDNYDVDQNRTAAVSAARPLADAVRDCVALPVEIRVAGGPLLERLEVPITDVRQE